MGSVSQIPLIDQFPMILLIMYAPFALLMSICVLMFAILAGWGRTRDDAVSPSACESHTIPHILHVLSLLRFRILHYLVQASSCIIWLRLHSRHLSLPREPLYVRLFLYLRAPFVSLSISCNIRFASTSAIELCWAFNTSPAFDRKKKSTIRDR